MRGERFARLKFEYKAYATSAMGPTCVYDI